MESGDLGLTLSARFEFGQNLLRNLFQGFKDADALEGDSFDDSFILLAEFGGENIDGNDVRQIALV